MTHNRETLFLALSWVDQIYSENKCVKLGPFDITDRLKSMTVFQMILILIILFKVLSKCFRIAFILEYACLELLENPLTKLKCSYKEEMIIETFPKYSTKYPK